MTKFIFISTLIFSFVFSAGAVELTNISPFKGSPYTLANGKDGNLYCKGCGGNNSWMVVDGMSAIDGVNNMIKDSDNHGILYWESMGTSCYFGRWAILSFATGKVQSIGPEISRAVCDIEPVNVNVDFGSHIWKMFVGHDIYNGQY